MKLQISKQIIGEDIIILGVYKNPDYNTGKLFPSELNEVLSKIGKMSLILMGDLNLDLLNPDSLTYSYLDISYHFGLKPCFKLPTRFGSTPNSGLDHVLFRQVYNSSKVEVKDCNTTRVSFSDHMAVTYSM